jgi:bacillolysin
VRHVRSWLLVVCAAVYFAAGGPLLHAQRPVSSAVRAAGPTLGSWAVRASTLLRDGTLRAGRAHPDAQVRGRTHQRLVQQFEGLPVFGGELVRQMNGRVVVSVHGRLFDNVRVVSTEPTLSEGDALVAAQRAAGADAAADEARLGVLPLADRYALVYRTTVRSPRGIRTYHVNAHTGAIEQSITAIRHQDVPGVGRGNGVLGDSKKVSAAQTSSGWQAIDTLRPGTETTTFELDGTSGRLADFLRTGALFSADVATTAGDNVWTDAAVVDAHAYIGWVYDYLFRRFGRRGLDDQNLSVSAIVHPIARAEIPLVDQSVVDTWVNNAAYLGAGFVAFGDGDGGSFTFFAGGLDVVAHELAHGITEFTSQLEYRDESGALDEAFADIIGVGAEFFHLRPGGGPQKGPNYQVGEDITRESPGFIRSLQNPIAGGYPDHYSLRQFVGTEIDNGGVHVNATIVGHAFFLAVAGGTNRVSRLTVPGIGQANIDRMERIFYRAFTLFLTPRAQFGDARAATLQAATDLFGANSNERQQLLLAWNAVGVQ